MTTLRHLCHAAARDLAARLGLDPSAARLESRVLLGHAMGRDRAWLIAHEHDTPGPEGEAAFRDLLGRRLAGEPVAYILGEREFYGLPFSVGPGVLIPRPETEFLVEHALARTPEDTPARLLDLGTGSGAVAITLALKRPHATVTAVDVSAEALAIATANARRHGVANLRLLQGDWYAPVTDETFDLIVSNPPYVAEDDPHLARGDVRFEPRGALSAGPDGLADLRRIVGEAPAHLAPGGWLLVEHGWDQEGACQALFRAAGFDAVFTAPDLAGLPRITGGRRPRP